MKVDVKIKEYKTMTYLVYFFTAPQNRIGWIRWQSLLFQFAFTQVV